MIVARTDALHTLPEGLVRLADGARITVAAFDLPDVQALARLRGLPASTQALRQIHELSAGVALHVCALLDQWEQSGDFEHFTAPASFAALVLDRLGRCDERTARLVEGAVAGPSASVDALAGMLNEHDPLDALDPAAAEDLIRVDRHTMSSPIRSCGPPSMTRSARAVGSGLHLKAAALAATPLAALLHRAHAAAGPDAALAGELEQTAGELAAAGRLIPAAKALREAADLSPGRGERERRGLASLDALWQAGDLATVRARQDEIERCEPSAARDYLLGRIAHTRLDLTGAERHYERAWAQQPDSARIAAELASCAYFRVDPAAFLSWARRAGDLSAAGGVVSPSAATKLSVALAMNGRRQEGLELLDRTLAAVQPGEPEAAGARVARGRLRLAGDDLAAAEEDLAPVVAAFVRGESSRSPGWRSPGSACSSTPAGGGISRWSMPTRASRPASTGPTSPS